mmetsp:Transcript_70354/g.205759  ORF Transcript_70354/g.205759 Transcript_70354/m.205759 type:complete len:363 (-) Transcript_70354:69-1157(-)
MGVGAGSLGHHACGKHVAEGLDREECCGSTGRPSCRFPLYAVPIHSIFAMDRMKSHEELMREGSLVQWNEGMGPLIFITHTWLGHTHPDPRGCKLALLKEFLRGSIERMKAQGHEHTNPLGMEPCQNVYVFLDYWSIPQAQKSLQAKAVRSIPAYVARCSALVCLAPAARHEDGSLRGLRAWRRRGWCRLECLCNALAPSPAPHLIVESATSAYVSDSKDWLFYPVCKGDFTEPKDKAEIALLIEQLIDARRTEALQQNDKRLCSFLGAMRGWLLAGADGHGPAVTEKASREWIEQQLLALGDGEVDSCYSPCCATALSGQSGFANEALGDVATADQAVHVVGNVVLRGDSLQQDLPRKVKL